MRLTVASMLLALMPTVAFAQCTTPGCATPPDAVERQYQACKGKGCVIPKLVILPKPFEICLTCDVPSWTKTASDKYARDGGVDADNMNFP